MLSAESCGFPGGLPSLGHRWVPGDPPTASLQWWSFTFNCKSVLRSSFSKTELGGCVEGAVTLGMAWPGGLWWLQHLCRWLIPGLEG